MPGQVIDCVRASTTDQNLGRQVTAISEAVASSPDRWFTDHASGATTTRPALEAMLGHVREQDTIVVTSMDRLVRSVIDLDRVDSHLTGRGVTVRLLKEGLNFQAATGHADGSRRR